MDYLLHPEKDIGDEKNIDWCLWLVGGGRTPEDFSHNVQEYNNTVMCGLVWTANFVAFRNFEVENHTYITAYFSIIDCSDGTNTLIFSIFTFGLISVKGARPAVSPSACHSVLNVSDMETMRVRASNLSPTGINLKPPLIGFCRNINKV